MVHDRVVHCPKYTVRHIRWSRNLKKMSTRVDHLEPLTEVTHNFRHAVSLPFAVRRKPPSALTSIKPSFIADEIFHLVHSTCRAPRIFRVRVSKAHLRSLIYGTDQND